MVQGALPLARVRRTIHPILVLLGLDLRHWKAILQGVYPKCVYNLPIAPIWIMFLLKPNLA